MKYPNIIGPDKEAGYLVIDSHGKSDGYFFAKSLLKTKNKLKLRVKKNSYAMDYDLKGDGSFELFPLNYGEGQYLINLYECINKNSYANRGGMYLNVQLKRYEAAFLVPNQYVNYSERDDLLIKAGDTDKEKFDAVCSYIKRNFYYDYIKAIKFRYKKNTLPDIQNTLKTKRGICLDLSALSAAMFRVQGIPSKLVIGHADRQYHAWTISKVNGKEVLFDPTAEINAIKKPKVYIPERFY